MIGLCPIGQAVPAAPGATRSLPIVAPARLMQSRSAGALPTPPCVHGARQRITEATRSLVVARGRANSSLSLPTDLDLEQPLPGFDSIASALADLAAGKLVVVLDDEDRENEGDLIMNADKVTTETMAFLIEHTSGVVCIAMEGRDLDRLRLPLMVSSAENEESMYTAFTITIDLRDGISTGISAGDRAKTIRRMADPSASASDFRRPGHIFPLRYRPGGVLVRPGHTEAGVDLARLSGSLPAGVLCEVVNKEDGSMARTPQLLEFAKRHGLRCITIADLIRYRLRHDSLVTPVGEPTSVTTAVEAGTTGTSSTTTASFTAHCFRATIDGTEHVAFVHGAVADPSGEVPVHVHHERTIADLVGSSEPGTSSGAASASSLAASLRSAARAGSGVVVYLRGQTARGLPPSAELAATSAYGNGSSGSGAWYGTDLKDAATAAHMLRSLGVRSVALAASGDAGVDKALTTALRGCGMGVRVVTSAVSEAGAQQHSSSSNGCGHVVGQPLTSAGRR